MNRPNTTTGSIISSATMKKLPVDSVMMKKPSSSLRKPSKAAATIMMEQKNIHFPEETIPESVKEYSLALQRDLKINSLYDIQNLTNIAREEIHNAKHIAKAICTRIKTANDDEKLPSLYLLDSIAKNVGGAYITEFANNLVDVFYYSFKAQTKIETQTRYLKLLKTWEPIFGNQLVHTIEEKIMRLPTYGPNQVQDYATLVQKHANASIYVNPKKFVKQTSIDFSNAAHQKMETTRTLLSRSSRKQISEQVVLVPPNNTKKARHVCKICGLGFPNKQLSTQHDLSNSALHKVKSSHHTTSHQAFSRSWFDQSDDEWASSSSNNTNVERVSITCLDASSIFGEGFSKSPSREYSSSDEEENTIHSTVLAPLDQDDCAICGEAFERILDDSSGEWMIKNACLDPNSGSFVHCACLNPKKRAHSSDSNSSSDKRIKYF
ncbi:hypothetical protein C9374_011471 [Naegleria lovaniensis]|uniref:CID domain-containing protein n=1 Tax=Naegleria lovaniensis TaxID=51637 RepID=A0AA88H2K0_NAELO|nr:uncharacterized protein C9374_011471 [Naegleria lovaniensis]KAG2392746.1 hypothetical protein C9374_011471 [Naegleria lovaniensis]